MSLYNYYARCDELMSGLIASLSTTDIDLLRKDCAALGFERWKRWIVDNLESVAQYARAVPSQRLKLKKWSDPELRRRLVLAAWWYIQCGRYFLEAIGRRDVSPGPSYRDIAVQAADAFWDIQAMRLVYWPFDDPDPFD